ncbi:MAG: hypothetical protein K0R54_294 [Clostridiaceae bacterium]|nr:hypothetical protein [Clostridiaceae bacterium]
MVKKSNIFKINEVVITNNLNKRTVNVVIDIYYPRINNVSIYENFSIEGPIMQIVKIWENGIVLLSKVKVNVGDFITFDIKPGESPSLSIMVDLFYVKYGKNVFLAKGKFINPSDSLVYAVENFLKSH